jgi:hypothetical protein
MGVATYVINAGLIKALCATLSGGWLQWREVCNVAIACACHMLHVAFAGSSCAV